MMVTRENEVGLPLDGTLQNVVVRRIFTDDIKREDRGHNLGDFCNCLRGVAAALRLPSVLDHIARLTIIDLFQEMAEVLTSLESTDVFDHCVELGEQRSIV